MSDELPLVNFEGTSGPATALVEKISEGIGGLCRPWQIKRVARAEAEADKIKALAQIDIGELQRRALTRFVAEETQKQENIENITRMAIEDLKDDAKPQDMENDWIANFFDKSKLISDKEMQSLWAKVLAGEANRPGKYSKRTVNFLSSIDKSDAELFTKLCGFCWLMGENVIPIYDHNDNIYKDNSVTFAALRHLEDLGLIKFDLATTYQRIYSANEFVSIYFGNIVFLKFPSDINNIFNIGHVMLTKIGQELTPISGAKPVEGFFDYIINKWRNKGYIPFSYLNVKPIAL